MKKVEVDVAIVKNKNKKLVNQLIEAGRQCWANAQYSKRKCLEVTGIPTSILNDLSEANVPEVFDQLWIHVESKYIQTCHHTKDNDRAIVKFGNRKESLQILRDKKNLKALNPTELDSPEATRMLINESLCAYYRGLWNKCTKAKGMGKLNVFFVSNGAIKDKMLEIDLV